MTLADRPAYQGRMHGQREHLTLEGIPVEREYQAVPGDGDTAFLVSQVDVAGKFQVQSGFDRIFATFHFK